MPNIEVDERTYDMVALAARVAEIPMSHVIAKALRVYMTKPALTVVAVDRDPDGRIPVFKVYRGERIEALFDPATQKIEITSGELRGKRFRSPSAAAVAVIRLHNPDREHPLTNGWRFWKLADGQPLVMIRGSD